MMNRWGNSGHGPGGDPSWLGGGGRDGSESQDAGGWSSDFGSDDRGRDSDFSRADSDLGGRRDSQAAEQMAPRFGDGALPSEEDSSWTSNFTGQDAKGSGSSAGGAAQVFRKVLPVIVMAVFAIFFFRMFVGGNGFGGIGAWWFLLIFGLPLVRKVIRMFRGGRDD